MSDPATIYEEWFVPAVFAPLAEAVVDHIVIPPGARVLDVACGSGIVARTIARRPGSEARIVGIDINEAMLATARRVAQDEGLAIAWRQGSAQDLPFENGAFDLVFCQMEMQFFPDKARAVAEMVRVLAPAGQVVVTTWRGLDQNPFFAAFDRAVRRHLDSPAIEIPFSLGDPAAVAVLLQESGFITVTVEPVAIEANYAKPERFVDFQVRASAAAIPALQGLDATAREALVAAIGNDMAEAVRDATDGDRLRFPLQGIVARGTKP